MYKIYKIVSMLVALLMTLVGLCKLLPAKSFTRVYINEICSKIENDTVLLTITSFLIVILGAVLFITTINNIMKEKKRHTFKVGSKRFYSFFSKWYSQTGPLSIICDDLEGWVKDSILDTLKTKSKAKELHLFLNKQTPVEIINELRDLGAIIDFAPDEIVSKYSFSCLSIMGNNSAVIIRDKQSDKSTSIVFEEIYDSYIYGLLNVIIKEGIRNGSKFEQI